MPLLRLFLEEARPGALPPICLICGKPAVTHAPRAVSWRPRWIATVFRFSLIFCMPLALAMLVIGLIQTRRATIDSPFCHSHRNYWAWRGFWVYAPLIALVVLGLGQALLVTSNLIGAESYAVLLIANAVLFIGWAIAGTIIQRTGLRVIEITDDEIILEPVSAEFIAALKRDRQYQSKFDGWDDYDPYPMAKKA